MKNKLASAIRQQLSLAKMAAIASSVGAFASAQAQQAPPLPRPCITNCGPNNISFVTRPIGSDPNTQIASYTTSGNVGTITQYTDRAILNWQSFNVDSGYTVNFVQPSSTSAALNRIFQNDPTRIFGTLNANGQVYLINSNGIVFGNGSQVNARGLIASALNVSDSVFFNSRGLAGAIDLDQNLPAFEGALPGQTLADDAAVQVLKGATLESGERVMLIAPKVKNEGQIHVVDGQAILAASQDSVYVASDVQLRGLLVEVDTGGSVENVGEIVSERGNTTLIGLAVNQQGRIRATTSVNVNGSIRLVAQDKATPVPKGSGSSSFEPTANHFGDLKLGVGSVTEVLPDSTSGTAVDGQAQALSQIGIAGNSIQMQSNARVTATGGIVSLNARPNTSQAPQVNIASGAVIDVSGDDTSVVAMERNQASLRLFGNELADSPLQRTGPLARQEVTIDLRKGAPIINQERIESLRDGVQRSVGERLATGGKITIEAGGGDVVFNPGSIVDISGGQIRYESGYLNTTKLISENGRVVDISVADPNVIYTGIAGRQPASTSRWGNTPESQSQSTAQFYAGYVEGRDAGELNITAARVATNGELYGSAQHGDLQRNAPIATHTGNNRSYDELPLQGRLSIDGLRALSFSNFQSTNSIDFDTALPASTPSLLSTSWLARSGVNRLSLTAGKIELGAEVNLALSAGGEIELAAPIVEVGGDVTSPSGRVAIRANGSDLAPAMIHVASSSNIDVAGGWVNDSRIANDFALGHDSLFIDGGRVSLVSQGDLILDAGSTIDVSAGAQLRSNNTLRAGRAGSVALTSKIPGSAASTELSLRSSLRGYGFDQGGALSISAASFKIENETSSLSAEVALKPEFFRTGGFASYSLSADRGSISLANDVQVLLTPQYLQLTGDFVSQRTGAPMDRVATARSLPSWMRGTSSFSATVRRDAQVPYNDAQLRIGANARIETEVRGSIALTSDADIYVAGDLISHGGKVDAALLSPNSQNESGFRANQSIFFDRTSDIDVSGVDLSYGDANGLRAGDIVAGGAINIRAQRGYILATEGSTMNVSGTHGAIHLPDILGRPSLTTVASDAGSINFRAAEGIVVSSMLLGHAGTPGANGGAISYTLEASGALRDPNQVAIDPAYSNLPKFPETLREIVVGENYPIGVSAGSNIPSLFNGRAFVSASRLREGGFDDLTLRALPLTRNGILQAIANGAIRFDGDSALSAGRRIELDASLVSGTGVATVNAPYVSIGPRFTVIDVSLPTSTLGFGSISVNASQLDLIGNSLFTGLDSDGLHLNSTGDIRLIGDVSRVDSKGVTRGALTTASNVALSAQQIYPATQTSFGITSTRSDGRISIAGTGAPQPPLSAGGVMRLSAADIVQGGTLRAPFGRIELNGTRSVRLLEGSVTSSSGANLQVPYGELELGADWVLPIGTVRPLISDVPESAVSLKAPTISVGAGATVDIAGGGDLLAWEFVKGPGGSRDILLANNTAGAFAVLPTANPFGVIDASESSLSGIAVGSTVYLSGGNGLPAGEYARLPARYALLPGAYLVVPTNLKNIQPNSSVTLADSATTVVAGRKGYAGTDSHDALWSGYAVLSGDQVRARAQYNVAWASEYFDNGARNPGDAGRLTINASQSIALDGTLSAASQTGVAAQVEVVANSLAVVNARTANAARVELVASELQNFGAASLLLGASRTAQTTDEDGTHTTAMDVQARTVSIDRGVSVRANEIALAGKESVTVRAGANLVADGAAKIESSHDHLLLQGDGAFVRVSSQTQVDVQRSQSSSASGIVSIEQGASLSGSGSINLESSRDVLLHGQVQTPGSLSLTASQISLGDAQLSTPGLVLSGQALSNLQADELLLSSRSTTDIYGALTATTGSLRIDSAGLRGLNSAGELAQIGANKITLTNSRGTSVSNASAATGSLKLSAETVSIEGGTFDINGFGNTNIVATHELIGDGLSVLRNRGDLTVQTPRITGASGSNVTINVDGRFVSTALSPTSTQQAVDALGARLDINAQSITHAARIELPSGVVNLNSTALGGISLASQSSIDVSGRDIDFGYVTAGSPGGLVNLNAAFGDITIASNATVNVSGAPSAGEAGRISLRATQGSVGVASDAIVLGTAVGGERQGSVLIDTRTLGGSFSALNAVLNAGSFSQSRIIGVQQGDLRIAQLDVVRAQHVDFATDTGALDIAGRIDARDGEGGYVRLNAGGNVNVAATAMIDARATQNEQAGGFVELGTKDGIVSMQGHVDVSGMNSGGSRDDSGLVRMHAPRLGNTGMAVNVIGASISGADRIELEASRNYAASIIDDALINSIAADTMTYMANASQIKGALGVEGDARYHLLPGVQVASASSLTLMTPWDLLSWRDGGEAGVLTLRAAGNLNLNAQLSDGFAWQSLGDVEGMPLAERDVVQTGRSWSYRLVAGARTNSGDPLRTNLGIGDLIIADATQIRTGTGSIDVVAGRNMTLSTGTSALYTIGENRGSGAVNAQDAEVFLSGDFVHDGGNISVVVGGDLRGVSDRPLPDWMPRYVGVSDFYNALYNRPDLRLPAMWAIDSSQFQGIGALGGGNMSVSVGGNMESITLAIPTTGQAKAMDGSDISISGGGSLRADIEGDMRGGVIMVDRGTAEIRSHSSIGKSASPDGLAPIIEIGDAKVALTTRTNAAVQSIFSPTMSEPSPAQGLQFEFVFNNQPELFFNYTDRSAFSMTSIGGDLQLQAGGDLVANQLAKYDGRIATVPYLNVWPASLSARSLTGDIRVTGPIDLYPGANSSVELLAGKNIDNGSSQGTINQSDADAAFIRSVNNTNIVLEPNELSRILRFSHAASAPVHRDDTSSSALIARDGSVRNLVLNLSESVKLSAGTDIEQVELNTQHARANDISIIEAGRDIRYLSRSPDGTLRQSNAIGISVAGSGNVDLIAGRNISFGTADGVETIGNVQNAALPDVGADINIWAGYGTRPDFANFTQRYLAQSDEYQTSLHEFIARYPKDNALSDLENFRALPESEQRRLIAKVLFSEIKEGGLGDYSAGFDALASLFPHIDSGKYRGDLTAYLSYIRTVDGGDINIVVPNGLVNAGLASASGLQKPPASLGVIAQGLGNINAVVHDDFLVNASRVFSLDGGDIMIWSSEGDIDAGRGSKAALSIPPPILIPNGDSFIVQFPPAVEGSGIRTAVSTPKRAPGNVYLFAPRGIVDAGDAGIVSAGNITIAATLVKGADNIQVGGTSTGVPVSSGGLGASLAGVSAAGSSAANASVSTDDATNSAEQNAPIAETALSWLEVFVVGLGEDSCKQDDIDCLKRQKTKGD